jgi:hypothetical protein
VKHPSSLPAMHIAPRYELAEFQARVKGRFDELRGDGSTHSGEHGAAHALWHTLDGSGSIDDVGARVMGVVDTVLARLAEGRHPLRRLWDGAVLSGAS